MEGQLSLALAPVSCLAYGSDAFWHTPVALIHNSKPSRNTFLLVISAHETMLSCCQSRQEPLNRSSPNQTMWSCKIIDLRSCHPPICRKDEEKQSKKMYRTKKLAQLRIEICEALAGGRICGQIVRGLVRWSGVQVRVSLTSYAVIGPAAYMGGSTRITLTSVVMVMETTGALQLVVPIMLTVFFAKVIK